MVQQNSTLSAAAQSLQALHARIEREAPWLHIIRCIEQPYPFIEVKDTSNLNIHVTFSSEAAFQTFIEVVGKGAVA